MHRLPNLLQCHAPPRCEGSGRLHHSSQELERLCHKRRLAKAGALVQDRTTPGQAEQAAGEAPGQPAGKGRTAGAKPQAQAVVQEQAGLEQHIIPGKQAGLGQEQGEKLGGADSPPTAEVAGHCQHALPAVSPVSSGINGAARGSQEGGPTEQQHAEGAFSDLRPEPTRAAAFPGPLNPSSAALAAGQQHAAATPPWVRAAAAAAAAAAPPALALPAAAEEPPAPPVCADWRGTVLFEDAGEQQEGASVSNVPVRGSWWEPDGSPGHHYLLAPGRR